jgi:hypothetical protein
MADQSDEAITGFCQRLIDEEKYHELSAFAKTSRRHHTLCAPLLRQARYTEIRDPHENNYIFTAQAYHLYQKIPVKKLKTFWRDAENMSIDDDSEIHVITSQMMGFLLIGYEDHTIFTQHVSIFCQLLKACEQFDTNYPVDTNTLIFEHPSYVVFRGRKLLTKYDYDRADAIHMYLLDMNAFGKRFERHYKETIEHLTDPEFLLQP